MINTQKKSCEDANSYTQSGNKWCKRKKSCNLRGQIIRRIDTPWLIWIPSPLPSLSRSLFPLPRQKHTQQPAFNTLDVQCDVPLCDFYPVVCSFVLSRLPVPIVFLSVSPPYSVAPVMPLTCFVLHHLIIKKTTKIKLIGNKGKRQMLYVFE